MCDSISSNSPATSAGIKLSHQHQIVVHLQIPLCPHPHKYWLQAAIENAMAVPYGGLQTCSVEWDSGAMLAMLTSTGVKKHGQLEDLLLVKNSAEDTSALKVNITCL